MQDHRVAQVQPENQEFGIGYAIMWFTGEQGKINFLMAAETGNVESLKFALDVGYNIEEKNSDMQNALMLSSMYGKIDVAKLLIERGAQIHSRDVDRMTPLLLAAMYGMLHIEYCFLKTIYSIVSCFLSRVWKCC